MMDKSIWPIGKNISMHFETGYFLTTYPNSHWWDSELQVSVPKADWEAEKVTISTIRNYLN